MNIKCQRCNSNLVFVKVETIRNFSNKNQHCLCVECGFNWKQNSKSSSPPPVMFIVPIQY